MLLNSKIPLGYIIKKIRTELIYIFFIVLIVDSFSLKFRHIIPVVPLAIPTFLGTAISVILSFKLNQSYDRWWEARKIWGSIVNDSRNLILQLQSFVALGYESVIKQIGFRQIGWCYCLGQSLRQLDPISNLEEFMSVEDITELARDSNKPLAILQLHSHDITELRHKDAIDAFSHVQLNTTIVNLNNSMGMAERIKSTVFPTTYRIFLHGAIYVFIVTLAIALRELENYLEIPLLIIIASFFFLLERTAAHLQDPFSDKPTDTPVTAIARTIEINIKQLLDEKDIPDPISPSDYYLK